ncbi:uncharacterized protein J3R85_010570 [Psidium guajava]|nr:uncharacterized protein J3R85_010570 [Psidium guajava]
MSPNVGVDGVVVITLKIWTDSNTNTRSMQFRLEFSECRSVSTNSLDICY